LAPLLSFSSFKLAAKSLLSALDDAYVAYCLFSNAARTAAFFSSAVSSFPLSSYFTSSVFFAS